MYRIGSLRHSNARMYEMDQFVWSNSDINVLGVTIAHDNLVEKNYEGIIAKVKTTLNMWYNRGLSLIGKIQVVNTLVASLFVYKMMVLPCIPRNIVKTVDNVIREFIWGGKKAKIAYKILQNPKREGGLNLVNLSIKDKALKATWPIILTGEEDYSKLVYAILKMGVLGPDLWRCTLHPQDVKQLRIGNDFWKDVVTSWCEYNYYTNFRIENQLIWRNSYLKIGGKTIMWSDVIKKGLLYVHQLFRRGSYKTYAEVQHEYGLTMIRFNSLKASIPGEWRIFLEENSLKSYLPVAPHTYDSCCADNFPVTKNVYGFLSDDIMLVHSKYVKWRSEVGPDFCEGLLDFGKAHMRIYKVTNNPKYRSFQYRLLQRGIITNIHLKKWGILGSDLCTFCKNVPETLVHLFCSCPVVFGLWLDIKKLLNEWYPRAEVCILESNIILNRISRLEVINFICLIVKQYVYQNRCLGKDLHIVEVKKVVTSIRCIERYIAIKNNKLPIHDKKWRGDLISAGSNNIDQEVIQYVLEH